MAVGGAESERPIRVLVVDDHRVVRHGLQSMLEDYAGIEVVGEASNGREALEREAELQPDVVLLDIRMPELDGIQTTAELQKRGSAAKVLVLTTYGEDEYLFPALKAGAHGYLLKTVDDAELVEAIRQVARGERLLEPSLVSKVMAGLASGAAATEPAREELDEQADEAALEYRARFNRRHGEGNWEQLAARYRGGATLAEIAEEYGVSPQAVHGWLERGGLGAKRARQEGAGGEARAELSAREREVLELVATGASNQEIADRLGVSVNTVRVHVSNIFEKLGIRSRAEAAAYLRRGTPGD